MKKANDDKKGEPNDLDRFISEVKALQFKCPQTVIGLPPRSKGLPERCYSLNNLLEFIIMNLEGKFPNCLKSEEVKL